MFDHLEPPTLETPDSVELGALVGLLAQVDTDAGDAELVERISALERVKAAAAAAQVRMTAAFAASQRRAQEAAGVPAERVGQGISAQVGLARHESPARATRYTGWATVLVQELPYTFAALQRGDTTEWRAMIVARETIWLSRTDRATVDQELADRLPTLGDRQVERETKKLAYRLDPHGYLARSRAAANHRRVSLRPAPDTMTRLTALLPAAQGVAAYGALLRAADTARATGDPRGRGQVMADTLVERVTGQTNADQVPVHINLVMTDHTLFGDHAADFEPDTDTDTEHRPHNPGADSAADGENDDDIEGGGADADAGDTHADRYGVGDTCREGRHNEPAHLIGYGPIPAGLARDLACVTNAKVYLRRLYRNPTTRKLAAMDSHARIFPAPIRHAVIIQDQICRTPWCNAPVRHTDHAKSVAEGGETSLPNGQGLCETCNYVKQISGWHTAPGPGGTSESVTTTTPTGHTYTSRPPDLPGAQPGPRPTSSAAASPRDRPHPPTADAQAA